MLVTEFIADKVKITGPNIDGGFKITFELGEYAQEQVAQLIKIPQQTAMKVQVNTE